MKKISLILPLLSCALFMVGCVTSYDSGEPYQDNSVSISNDTSTQDMINTQNMINNQNMVNNIQDMVNTQNMVNAQNAAAMNQ